MYVIFIMTCAVYIYTDADPRPWFDDFGGYCEVEPYRLQSGQGEDIAVLMSERAKDLGEAYDEDRWTFNYDETYDYHAKFWDEENCLAATELLRGNLRWREQSSHNAGMHGGNVSEYADYRYPDRQKGEKIFLKEVFCVNHNYEWIDLEHLSVRRYFAH